MPSEVQDKMNVVDSKDLRSFPRDRHVYWPSESSIVLPDGSVAGMCMRASFYNIMRVPPTDIPTIKNVRAMGYGKAIEEWELERAKSKEIYIADNFDMVTIYQHIKIKGKADGLYFVGNNLGIEYKTGSGYYFHKEIWGSNTTAGNPKIPHLLQTMLYLTGSPCDPRYTFNCIHIIYIDRGTCEDQTFVITMDNGHPVIDGEIEQRLHIQGIYDRFMKLDEFITKQSLPPADFTSYYDNEDVVNLYNQGKISKNQYQKFNKRGCGEDSACAYCKWLTRCKKDNYLT